MEVAVNLDKVGGADKDFRQKIISTYWGGKIECEAAMRLRCAPEWVDGDRLEGIR
jgi:hypothetical protein